MTMSPVIYCLVNAEPERYYTTPGMYAVNLSFECFSDNFADEYEAKQAFEKFLELVQGPVNFAVYQVNVNTLDRVSIIQRKFPARPATSRRNDLFSWLKSRVPAGNATPGIDQQQFWTRAEPVANKEVVAVTAAGAGPLLRAVHAWNAPVGHRFGLTYVIEVEPLEPGKAHAVLPFFGNVQAPDQLVFACEDTTCDLLSCAEDPNASLKTEFGSEIPGLRCRTAVLKQGHSQLLGGRLTREGYFRVNRHAIPLQRLLIAFEHRACGLMAVTPSLFSRGRVQDAAQHDEAAYEQLFQLEKSANRTLVPVALIWAAVSGLLAALDNIVIAMMKPVSDLNTEGELLAPLVSAIEDELKKSNPTTGLTRKQILNAIRDALAHSPLIVSPGGHDRRAEVNFDSALRHVYDLSEKSSADTPVDMQLFHSLLAHSVPDSNGNVFAYEIGEELSKAMGSTPPIEFLMRALSNVQATLSEESGAETAVIRLFETAADNASVGSVATLIERQLSITAKEPVAKAWIRYCSLLNGPFNGAEAVRRSASLELLHTVYQGKDLFQFIDGPSPENVATRIQQSKYFERRLTNFDGAELLFDHIAWRLVYYPWPNKYSYSELSLICNHLDRAYKATMSNLRDLAGEGKRFVPDMAPQPLPLQITGDITGALLDEFLDDFNGIALAIHREDQPGFAHANLAELHWSGAILTLTTPPKVPFTLHPFLPTVNDGRGPAFVEYHGAPFADASLASVLTAPTTKTAQDKSVTSPFYAADVVDDLKGQLPLPRLAYGCHYDSFAFAVTNAGALPVDQRLSEQEPWLPGVANEPAPDVIAHADYQRRTAIGELEIAEFHPQTQMPLTKDQQRLNRNLPDVVALTSDYPRVSVVAAAQSLGTVDLYRESDGIGTLALAFGQKNQELALSIADVQITGQVDHLWLRIQNGPAATPSPFDRREDHDDDFICEDLVDDLSNASIRLVFNSKFQTDFYELEVSLVLDGARKRQLGTLRLSDGDLVWLRLVLKAGTDVAAVSFTAPECPTGSRPAPSLLLMASPQYRVWQPEQVMQPACFKVSTPRVGYLDFQRWMANRTLRDQAVGDPELAEQFYTDLAALYSIRSVHSILGNFFDRLPDPAVTEIGFSWCETDRLCGGNASPPCTVSLQLAKPKGLLHSIATRFTRTWADENSRGKAISTLMKDIDEQFSFKLTLNCDEKANLQIINPYPADLKDPDQVVPNPGVIASFPEGKVVQFTIDARVESRLFSFPIQKNVLAALAPIHSGLLQYASSSTDSHHAFPMAALCIETMVDALPVWVASNDRSQSTVTAAHQALIELAYQMIGFKAAANARRYNLVTAQEPPLESDRNAWRIYSHARVISQQWRYSGRPIYRALNPKRVAWGRSEQAQNVPVLETSLRLQDHASSVLDFEDELFFDRSNIDADTLPIKLDPLPASTVLQTVTWDSPSACYWRHRFVLKSRYSGALKSVNRREIEAFLPFNEAKRRLADTWTLRAAMFADLAHIQLTRPQLRALIPLTTTTAGDTPSVLAVLQEPPLAHGGLAERISAELKTGFGYGFESPDFVEIRDARKEIGPDPTLTYSAMPNEVAMGLALTAEGPIGLTFDSPHAAAPLFANSMFSLTPIPLDEKPLQALEEHFLGILMQRHLDPDWLPDLPAAPVNAQNAGTPGRDADRCWWIEMPLDQTADNGLMWNADEKTPFVRLERGQGQPCTITVSKVMLDGVAGLKCHEVTIVKVPQDAASVAFLHQPVAPGQYGLSIFLPRESADITRGRSATWQKVASFVWSPPATPTSSGIANPTEEKQLRRILLPEGASVRATAASASTFLAWARTHRDFANLTLGHAKRSNAERALVSDLTAKCVDQGKRRTLSIHFSPDSAPLHLTSSTEASPVPLRRARHLAYVMTRLRDEPGRPIEEYVHSGLLNSTTSSLPEDANVSGRLNIRVIEFETSALILSGTAIKDMPGEYRRHELDLVATGSNKPGHLKLMFRFVGIAASLPKELTLRLEVLQAGQTPSKETDLTPIPVKPGTGSVRAIEVWLHPNSSTITSIDLNGVANTLVLDQAVSTLLNQSAKGLVGCVGLALSFDATTDAGECWCDVSMLHTLVNADDKGPLNQKDALDLRWLFSRDLPDEMAQALMPDAMASRTEAQARIVSVSPPMAVVIRDK
ncbi:hypothetical protein DM813_27685 [Pseudomonas alkylphenolica]|uniref:Uncharacterized protein n=1 Tax=Pseudomonas alkylphenolica TaxID=237609 RepID=A0A443ZEN4_9PSED|nr:hypothetical protein [Pseudomonas alkylphenolica]RWU17147.1 hypothetical protein DM813_27685 [Pseudomonas alkylphenolica]